MITTHSALLIDDKFSLNGPDGITKPLPINCFELKHKIDKSGFIEKSWNPSSKIARLWLLLMDNDILVALFLEVYTLPFF